MKQVVTHNGRFHADDVFAYVVLVLVFKDVVIQRSRDQGDIKKADIVFDVGGVYDPQNHRYDHHMQDAPTRDNGNPYSSIGLIWRDYGREAIKRVMSSILDESVLECTWDDLDKTLILEIDQADNGQSAKGPGFVSALIEAFNPNWNDPQDYDGQFTAAANFAHTILVRAIRKSAAYATAKPLVTGQIKQQSGRKILVLEESLPWQSIVPDADDTILFVVHPNEAGDAWYCHGVPVEPGAFEVRQPLPHDWRGLENDALIDATGVRDARFCHRRGFVCSASSLSGAKQLAEAAIQGG